MSHSSVEKIAQLAADLALCQAHNQNMQQHIEQLDGKLNEAQKQAAATSGQLRTMQQRAATLSPKAAGETP